MRTEQIRVDVKHILVQEHKFSRNRRHAEQLKKNVMKEESIGQVKIEAKKSRKEKDEHPAGVSTGQEVSTCGGAPACLLLRLRWPALAADSAGPHDLLSMHAVSCN